MEVDKESDKKSDILPHWMVAHALLKKEITEAEKYHNLLTWLKSYFFAFLKNGGHFVFVFFLVNNNA